jgi:nudix-type nucleoside diphosphatase (YffH/AdpP family)
VSKPYEILSVDRVFDGFFAVDRAKVKFGTRAGNMSEPHERLCVERGDAAAALIHLIEEDIFIFARQFRYPCVKHDDPWLIEAVAGKIDGDETPEAAARREALEEAGYKLDKVVPALAFYGSPGGLSELTHIFYAPVTAADQVTAGGGTDEGEDVELVRIPTRMAVEMAFAGRIRDAKALVALLWFAGRDSA